jgi:predicted PurR-regulated permease PerM
MIKRGLIVMMTGVAMIIIAFAIVYSIIPPTAGMGENFFPTPENLFDSVTENQRIEPGTAFTFSHTSGTSQVPLMWGLHIINYQQDDSVSITISNIFGDKFGSFDDGDPIFIKSFMIPKVDTYNFDVENKGKNPVIAAMMFTENPEKSKALNDPNSIFHKSIVPLAIAGLLVIVGIIVLIAGIILGIVDWKKGKNQSRYI